MAKLEFQREGPSGPRLLALLNEIELKRLHALEGRRETPSEINLLSQEDMRAIIGQVGAREVVRLGRSLKRGGEFSSLLGKSLLASVSLTYTDSDYPVGNTLENIGLDPEEAGEVMEAMEEVRRNNQDVHEAQEAGLGISKQTWDPIEVLRTHVTIQNRDRMSHIQRDEALTPAGSMDVNSLGTSRTQLDKLSRQAVDEGIPYGLKLFTKGEGRIMVSTRHGDKKFQGVESLAAQEGRLFIKYRYPSTYEFRFHVYEGERDSLGITDRTITGGEISKKYGKVAEMFGIPAKNK